MKENNFKIIESLMRSILEILKNESTNNSDTDAK